MPVHRERENMSKYSTRLLGFGDNVVDIYDHLKTMYPGGNCVNVSVYGKMAGCEKTAYMGYFGDDDRAELIMDTLEKIGVETVKCRQLHGENGYSRITLKDGDRVVMIEDVTTSGKSMEETVPKVRGAADVEIVGLMVSLNRMEVGLGGKKSALDEIREKYGFAANAIVTMEEVVEHLYNRTCGGRVVIDDEIKAAIDKYYEQYGVK